MTPERLAAIRNTNNVTSSLYGTLARSYIRDLITAYDAQEAEIERLRELCITEAAKWAVRELHQMERAESAEAQLTRYKAVVEAARARMDVWTRETYVDLEKALAALDDTGG